MKKIINLRVLFALLLIAAAPLAATAQITTYFYDNFSNGSTTNGLSLRGGSPTASYTSYDIASTKATIPLPAGTNALGIITNGCTITPNDFRLALSASTSSGFLEAQAMFVTNAPGGTNAIALAQPGDYIDLVVVFTNTAGTLLPGTTCTLWLGLFNSGGSYYPTNVPVPGALAQSGLSTTAGSTNAASNCANWQGYFAQMENGGNATRISTRPAQGNNGTSAAQDLLGSGVGAGAFNNPTATTLETAPGSPSFTFTTGGTYTMRLIFTLTAPNVMTVSNYLYSGPGTNGTVLLSHGTTNVSGANFLTGAFDGLAIGALNKVAGNNPTMDISSISITGTNTVITTPPTITLQPSPVIVATNGACAFFVNAVGFGVNYQWARNGTNLLDGGNISGSKTSQLVISPAGTSDALSTNNGYYVIVSGTGGYSTNSVTNSLTLIPATNLYYSAGTWDVHNSSSWDTSDSGSRNYVFDYGDPVNFGNNGGGTVTLNGPYLSAASVTMSQSSGFLVWAGTGSFAGPGNLIYNGSAQFTINNANTYSGGTIISNASANLRVGNLNGLGTGPITVAMAGGKMEIIPAGGASSGIPGDIIVSNDFTIQYDALGSYAAVLLGNLSGNPSATLTLVENGLNAGSGTNNRVRIYSSGTTNDAIINPKIILNDSDTVLAPYNTGGFQIYNGVISGAGTVEEKGYAIFNAANTYTGGNPGGMYLAAGNTGLGINSDGSPGSVTDGPLGTGALLLWVDSTGTSPANSGGIFAYGGARTLGNAIEYPSSTNNLTLIVNGTNDLTFTGPITLNGNDAFYTNTLPSNMVLYSNRTFQVTNTGLTTFSGVISDFTNGVSAGMGLIKTGSGVLALSSGVTEIYTGPTAILGGTLQVNAILDPASAVTVSNGILSGTGTVNGTVFVNTNGTLAPGATSIGILNINNSLTLAGNVAVRVNRSGSQADKAIVSGALTNIGTGTIKVTNLGSTLQVGDTFTLFNKALSNSAALLVTGGGVAWANNLAVNGTIQVVSPPDLAVLQIGPASVQQGANITNTIRVTNLGPNTATGILVTNTLGTYETFVSATSGGTTNAAGQVVWSGISLLVNTSTNLTLVVKSVAGGNATNTVIVASSSTDPNSANNTSTLVTAVIPPADTGVSVTGTANATIGSSITYTITTTNAGPGVANSMIVTDTLPANVTFVSASNGGTTNGNAGMVVWSGFSLAVNTSSNFTLNALAAAGGNATNKVTVVSSGADTNQVNNAATNVTVIPSTIIPQVSAHIGTISMDGLNVVIGGTNGVNGGTYYLLASTNAATPLAQWPAVATNVVSTNGAGGAFTFTGTNVVTPNGEQQFYILSNTNNY